MAEPSAPGPERREWLLDVLRELVARGGPERLLAVPVAPGRAAFPDRWEPTRSGVALVLRRLAWHAGEEREIAVRDERLGAPPTQRKPETHVELTGVRVSGMSERLELTSWFVGEDDVAGTLAHELGVAHAVIARSEAGDPYREMERVLEVNGELDCERGSVATVYLGLGVLAANAAYQQYSGAGRFNGGYSPLEYDVLRAGYVPMSELAFALAVQATVRGESRAPAGLSPPQRDEVTSWIEALSGRGAALRARLGIAEDARGVARPAPEAFAADEAEDDREERIAFRWPTSRAGEGFLSGALLGIPLGAAIATLWMGDVGLVTSLASPALGIWLGKRRRVWRCSTCATSIAEDAETCRTCGATIHGAIANRGERLEAEERVLASRGEGADGAARGRPRAPRT